MNRRWEGEALGFVKSAINYYREAEGDPDLLRLVIIDAGEALARAARGIFRDYFPEQSAKLTYKEWRDRRPGSWIYRLEAE